MIWLVQVGSANFVLGQLEQPFATDQHRLNNTSLVILIFNTRKSCDL